MKNYHFKKHLVISKYIPILKELEDAKKYISSDIYIKLKSIVLKTRKEELEALEELKNN